MARKSTTDTGARAKVDGSIVQKSSNTTLTMFDEKTITNIAETAFADKENADKINGTAQQRMACAVLATWLNWRNNGHPDPDVQTIADLSVIVEKSEAAKLAMTALKPLMSKALIGEPINTENMSYDDKATTAATRTAKLALLTRGMVPAAILYRAGVTLDMFKREIGCFAVPGKMLLENGHEPRGVLASGGSIMLNNRTYSAENSLKNQAAVRVKASIDQLARAYRSQEGIVTKRDNNGGARIDLKNVDPSKLSGECNLATLIAALHAKFVTPANVKRKPMMPNDLPANVWQMLSDIAQENDAVQDNEVFRAAVKSGITPDTTVNNEAANKTAA